MKWINGETSQSKYDRRIKWHQWFAWYPVTVGRVIIGNKTRKVKAWLQPVMRKWRDHHFDYKEIGQ
jgi:hypothetical protein